MRNGIRLEESSLTLAAVEHDALTGLYTEQAFSHYANQMMKFKPDLKMHLIEAKIKDFKLINTIYGTKKADELLRYLAATYSEGLKNGMVARRGSSSFVCMFYEGGELDHKRITEIVENVMKKSPITGVKIKYGIYEDVDKSLSVSTICDYASIAAETVMENYDCDLAYYTEKMAQKRSYEQMIENSFEDALHDQEFVVYYQPKVDSVTEKVIGAEALVRWKKADGSVVSPGDFIPVYEKDGLIERLDEYVFRKAKLLNMQVLAEGVETKDQLEELRKMKCDEVQGFYYARPMPEDEFVAYVNMER